MRGDRGRARTCNSQLRRLVLYPIERCSPPLTLILYGLPSRGLSSRVSSALVQGLEAAMYLLIYVTSMVSACGLVAYLAPKVG